MLILKSPFMIFQLKCDVTKILFVLDKMNCMLDIKL